MAIRFHHRVLAALRSFFRRRTVEDELDAELQFHLQQLQAHEVGSLRRIGSSEGGVSRHAHAARARRLHPGPSFRRPATSSPACVHRRRCSVAGAGDRRQQRDLLPDQRHPAASSARGAGRRALRRRGGRRAERLHTVLLPDLRGRPPRYRPARRTRSGQQYPDDAARLAHGDRRRWERRRV